jgi:inosose dehydratase
MIRVANAPCSWGILEFNPSTPANTSPLRAGGSRGAPYTQVLDEIRETGYAGTELGDWGFMPTDPARLHDELAARSLALVGAFVPVALARAETHAPGIQTAVRTARLMRDAGAVGAFIVLSDNNASVPAREQRAGRIGPEDSLDERQWTTFGDGAERIARAVKEETGLRTVFHPHCGGYVETEAEIDQLMARTRASLVGLLIDTGHIMYGGGDPLRVLKRHASRVTHVHFKDCDEDVAAHARATGQGYLAAVREQVFCELGEGDVDFKAVTEELRRMDYNGWIVVEQDVFPGYGTPAQSAKRSRDYLRGLGL